jgi:DNA-binding NtrC family response regulator
VLLDLELPDGNGLDLLPDLEHQPEAEVVIITGHGSMGSAIAAFRGGAVDYLEKPVDLERLQSIASRFQRTFGLKQEIRSLRHELRALGRFGAIIGRSKQMQRVYDLIGRVAPTNSTVLVRGETGTGKELVAETLHRLSPRSSRPFIALNCGAVTPTLAESELFGHEKGSFTGADRQHRGVFERADGGTLFLDEISEMSLDLQVRLLRVLESHVVSRVGGDRQIKVDARVVAASNRDLEAAVADGKFRQDLFYRLNVFPIDVPPLRERPDDVELLAEHFLDILNHKIGGDKRFAPDALERLTQHRWPGNVRELKNLVERAYILSENEIGAAAIPLPGSLARREPETTDDGSVRVAIGTPIAAVERLLIEETLRHHDGNKQQTAKTLGISVKTLYNRLNAYGAGAPAAGNEG